MPTLDELRRQLRAEELEVVPVRSSWRSERLYKVSKDGKDALLKFGRYCGQSLSQIAAKEPGYISFILRSEFPNELKDVARHVADAARARRLAPPDDDDEDDEPKRLPVELEELFK